MFLNFSLSLKKISCDSKDDDKFVGKNYIPSSSSSLLLVGLACEEDQVSMTDAVKSHG